MARPAATRCDATYCGNGLRSPGSARPSQPGPEPEHARKQASPQRRDDSTGPLSLAVMVPFAARQGLAARLRPRRLEIRAGPAAAIAAAAPSDAPLPERTSNTRARLRGLLLQFLDDARRRRLPTGPTGRRLEAPRAALPPGPQAALGRLLPVRGSLGLDAALGAQAEPSAIVRPFRPSRRRGLMTNDLGAVRVCLRTKPSSQGTLLA